MRHNRFGVLAAFALGLYVAPSLRGATIFTQSYTPVVGTQFRVTVFGTFSLPLDVYAFQFDLAYNPSVIQLADVVEGPFLPMGGTTFFLPGTIDNTAGTVTSVADTLVGPVP